MRIAFVILVILCLVGILILFVRRKPRPVDKSLATYTGKLHEYHGDKKLLVAFTASWASVWKLTAEALKQLDFSRYDLSIVDDATDREQIRRHQITVLPTVALVEQGRISKSVTNLTNIEQIKNS